MYSRETTYVARATLSLFFEKKKTTFKSFLKKLKTILDIGNTGFYDYAKFPLKIQYISGMEK
jgi:hypothetical protein